MALRLGEQGYQVDVADGVAAGVKLARKIRPDLLVLDATESKLQGQATLEHFQGDPTTTDIPVLLLTDKDSGSAELGTWVGVGEHVAGPFSLAAVVGKVSAMLRPSSPQPEPARTELRAGPISLNMATYRAGVDGQEIALTLTEFRLLATIIAAGGKALTRQELIAEAIGPKAVVTSRTVDVHMAALRHKLRGARNYIETVRGVGYRLGQA